MCRVQKHNPTVIMYRIIAPFLFYMRNSCHNFVMSCLILKQPGTKDNNNMRMRRVEGLKL